jgi:hypothetical protein
MHPLIDIVRTSGSPEQAQKANNASSAINLEDDFVNVIADKAIAVVANRLKEKRGTTVAPINDAPSLRANGISINEWAKWRKSDQDPIVAFGVIGFRITNLIAQHLRLEPAQVTVKVDVDSVNNISRIVFHFAESVTRVPTN